jgi:hypothetical protein
MRDDEGRGERIKDLSPIALYLAHLERRIRPVTEEDIEDGFDVEKLVNYDAVLEILNTATDENARAIARKIYDAFYADPLDPWLKRMSN